VNLALLVLDPTMATSRIRFTLREIMAAIAIFALPLVSWRLGRIEVWCVTISALIPIVPIWIISKWHVPAPGGKRGLFDISGVALLYCYGFTLTFILLTLCIGILYHD
jgi:hypothetical protein